MLRPLPNAMDMIDFLPFRVDRPIRVATLNRSCEVRLPQFFGAQIIVEIQSPIDDAPHLGIARRDIILAYRICHIGVYSLFSELIY